MKSLPTVVIVGRTNVGKSTLFNRISVNAKSLTLNLEGVTRDFIKDTVCWLDRCFDLIDTGGISLAKTNDEIAQKVRATALQCIEQADRILFVCDGTTGMLPEDSQIARILRPFSSKVILVINKEDSKKTSEFLPEFERLGFVSMAVSAQHGTGIGELLSTIVKVLPQGTVPESSERYCKVVLLGKPNVGKSSLLNALLQEDRAIVSDQPGTTREPITEKIRFNKAEIALTDTAGIRKKSSVSEGLETLMVKSSFRAVDEADIVVLLVDASQGRLSDQELKLAFYVFEQCKALIILFNKQDVVTPSLQETMEYSLEQYEHLLSKISTLSISCKTGKNIGKIIPLVHETWQRATQQFDDTSLTHLFKEALEKKPLYHKTALLHVYKVKQVAVAPITVLMFVNEPKWFQESQRNFFENCMRRAYDLQGVPIKFLVRKRG